MNLETRQNNLEQIHKLEGLLAYAEQTGDAPEIARIKSEIRKLVEECGGDGCCCAC